MVNIGSRHEETLTQIVRTIDQFRVAEYITNKPQTVCYYGQGTCDPQELKMVLLRSGSSRYYFHLSCYHRLFAHLLN